MTPRDEAFARLQVLQRGTPEGLFLPENNPGAGHSSMFQWMMEHTGDLAHRAASFEEDGGGGPAWGFAAVFEKVEKLHRCAERLSTNSPRDQARRNFAHLHGLGRQTSLGHEEAAYVAEMDEAGRRYAAGYRQLALDAPPWTWLQAKGLEAAIALGEQDWPVYYRLLTEMLRALRDADETGDAAVAELYYRERP